MYLVRRMLAMLFPFHCGSCYVWWRSSSKHFDGQYAIYDSMEHDVMLSYQYFDNRNSPHGRHHSCVGQKASNVACGQAKRLYSNSEKGKHVVVISITILYLRHTLES